MAFVRNYQAGSLFLLAATVFASVATGESGNSSRNISSQEAPLAGKCRASQAGGNATHEMPVCPPAEPRLIIETKTQLGSLNRISVDRNCKTLATETPTGEVKLWALPDGRFLRAFRGPGFELFGGIGGFRFSTLSPDGMSLAAGAILSVSPRGEAKKKAIYVIDTTSGEAKSYREVEEIGALTFSADMRYLAVAGKRLRFLALPDLSDVAVDSNNVEKVVFGPNGTVVAISRDSIFLYDEKFKLVRKRVVQELLVDVAFDQSGKLIAVGMEGGGVQLYSLDGLSPVTRPRTQLRNPLIFKETARVSRFAGQDQLPSEIPLRDTPSNVVPCGDGFAVNMNFESDTVAVLLDGKFREKLTQRNSAIDYLKMEIAGQLQVSSDGRFVRLGVGSSTVYFDPTTGSTSGNQPDAHFTKAVSLPFQSQDRRFSFQTTTDGILSWTDAKTETKLLSFFLNKTDMRWVAWTTSGYYMASPGGEDMLGWHVNRGWDQVADFFSASRFRERFNRPDIVKLVLVTLDEREAIRQANTDANTKFAMDLLTGELPPVVKILSPSEGGVVRDKEITVEYELRSPSGLPVDTVEVLIDGRPSRGIRRLDAALSGTKTERQTISLPNRDVELGLRARSGSLASEVTTVRLKWSGVTPADDEGQLKPKLYGVIVGVSAYADPALQLKFAAKDARDFAAALRAQKGGLYRDVELTVLTDAEATNSAIKDAFDNLGRQVTSRDVGVVFLAGHGEQDNRNAYYFLAANSDRNRLLSTAVEGVILREQLRALSGKVLVFLDTCYAGQAMSPGTRGTTDINMLVNELSSTANGVVTYASSTGRELSQEDMSWNNGVFTKALIEGMGTPGTKARADVMGKGVITTAALDLWVSERVKELTRGSQHPVMIRPSTIPDFPLFTAGN